MNRAVLLLALVLTSAASAQSSWSSDPIWHDGLVEKAVYDAERVVYDRPRPYQMIIFTNKEQHDTRTLTKAEKSKDTVEVWKHNQLERIPTPNYDYLYETTSHLTVDGLDLTRLDCSSQEFCGTSFKQYLRKWPVNAWDYWSFSYMPETGRQTGTVVDRRGRKVVAEDSLPLYLRGFDFAGKKTQEIALLPSQKNNRPTPSAPVAAVVRYAGEEDGSHKLEVLTGDELLGTYWMAADRLHVMTRYEGADGQKFRLKEQSRVNYWTRNEP